MLMVVLLLLLQAALEIRQLKETITAKDVRVQELVQQVRSYRRSAVKVCMHCTQCTTCVAQIYISLSMAKAAHGAYLLSHYIYRQV
jgi:uncharacterized protein (UPF0212 family)